MINISLDNRELSFPPIPHDRLQAAGELGVELEAYLKGVEELIRNLYSGPSESIVIINPEEPEEPELEWGEWRIIIVDHELEFQHFDQDVQDWVRKFRMKWEED
jgi:hypothetical protein